MHRQFEIHSEETEKIIGFLKKMEMPFVKSYFSNDGYFTFEVPIISEEKDDLLSHFIKEQIENYRWWITVKQHNGKRYAARYTSYCDTYYVAECVGENTFCLKSDITDVNGITYMTRRHSDSICHGYKELKARYYQDITRKAGETQIKVFKCDGKTIVYHFKCCDVQENIIGDCQDLRQS